MAHRLRDDRAQFARPTTSTAPKSTRRRPNSREDPSPVVSSPTRHAIAPMDRRTAAPDGRTRPLDIDKMGRCSVTAIGRATTSYDALRTPSGARRRGAGIYQGRTLSVSGARRGSRSRTPRGARSSVPTDGASREPADNPSIPYWVSGSVNACDWSTAIARRVDWGNSRSNEPCSIRYRICQSITRQLGSVLKCVKISAGPVASSGRRFSPSHQTHF